MMVIVSPTTQYAWGHVSRSTPALTAGEAVPPSESGQWLLKKFCISFLWSRTWAVYSTVVNWLSQWILNTTVTSGCGGFQITVALPQPPGTLLRVGQGQDEWVLTPPSPRRFLVIALSSEHSAPAWKSNNHRPPYRKVSLLGFVGTSRSLVTSSPPQTNLFLLLDVRLPDPLSSQRAAHRRSSWITPSSACEAPSSRRFAMSS